MRRPSCWKAVTSLSAVCAVLASAGAAHAATPFNVGTGRTPSVAIDSTGVGHVVWQIDDTGDRIGYCRVPKNGTACDVATELSYPAGTGADGQEYPYVFAPAPGKVVVVGACFVCGAGGATDRLYRWISTTSGASFAAPVEIADNVDPGGFGEFIDSGDIAIAIGGASIIAGPTALATTPIAVLSGGHVYSPSVVRVPGQNQLVAASSNLSAISFSVMAAASLTAANINNIANWTGAAPPNTPDDNDNPALGAGGSGVFLTYDRFVPADDHVLLQRYDPVTKTFLPGGDIEGSSTIDDSAGDPDVAVDSTGPHVIWNSSYDGGRLRYRRSTDAGATFGPVLNIALRDTYIDPQIAVAADGSSGFATWYGIGASTIKVVALDPQPEPVVAPPPPPPPPIAPPPLPPPPPPPAPPAVFNGTTKSVTSTDSRATFSLKVPKACVRPGQLFDVTMSAKRKKRKGNLFIKLFRVDFYLGTKRLKIDKKAPFVYRYRIVAGTTSGSTIKLRARAFMKVKRGKSPTKSLRATIKVC
jgi:hypothetical protein